MRPALNPLVLSLQESATLAINQQANDLRRKGEEIFHFGFGQAAFPVPSLLKQALIKHAGENRYLPTLGLPQLREAAAAFHRQEFGLDFHSRNIIVGPGSKELIFQLIYLVEGTLLIPAPSWVSYGPQAALRGKQVKTIPTCRENFYKLTPDELDKSCYKLGQTQKLLILNNPNNPTGAVYTAKELEALAEICRAYNVLVISDEIYAMINFTGLPQASMSHYYKEGTMVSSGLSKSFSAGGYRLGLMMIPDELSVIMDALKSVASETFSSVSAPVQYAAAEAYSSFDSIRSFISKANEIYRTASRYLYHRFTAMELNCPEPMGAFYLFPDFDNFRRELEKQKILTGTRLTRILLEEEKVALLPGSAFYFPAGNLGVRVASVDFDGGYVLENWPGEENLRESDNSRFFPNLVGGCNKLESYLRKL